MSSNCLRGFRRMLRLALLLAMGMHALCAVAHEMTIAEMSLREVAPGEFIWAWGIPGKNKPLSEDLTPEWPQGCKADARLVRCANKTMTGSLAVKGLGNAYSATLVRITYLDGQQRVYTLTSAQPQARLMGTATDERGAMEIAGAYIVLGVEHILSGVDHLLFVISLLFLVGFCRQLVWTITAFTVAHSITLALSAMDWLVLRSPPVEACIALSIVLVCAEALHQRQTLARRWPAVVAFLFGLVHGLGFAGALKEIGLPENHLAVSLLGFNVGVEMGQLLVLALAWGIYWASRRFFAIRPQYRLAMLYGMGTVAAYWSVSRMLAIVTA